MKIVVAGGTGFIGRSLVRQLIKDGHDVTVLLRSHKSAQPGYFPPNARLTPFDQRPIETDAVINLAGQPVAGLWTSYRKKAIMDSRVDTTQDLVEWMGTLKSPPKVFLSGSAVGFYGDRGDQPITEHDGRDPKGKFRAQVCILWEEAANQARKHGVRVVNLRVGNVLEKSGGMLGKMVPLLRLAPFIAPINPKAFLPWVSMQDAIGAMEFALTHEDVTGPLNITAPTPATWRGFFTALGPIVHRLVIGQVPKFAVKAALGEFSEALLDSQKVLPEKLSHAGYIFKDPELGPYLASHFAKGSGHRQV